MRVKARGAATVVGGGQMAGGGLSHEQSTTRRREARCLVEVLRSRRQLATS